jgi:hypothetical protein
MTNTFTQKNTSNFYKNLKLISMSDIFLKSLLNNVRNKMDNSFVKLHPLRDFASHTYCASNNITSLTILHP